MIPITVKERLSRLIEFPIMFGSAPKAPRHRSEEHTSELQSQSNLVCRLLLEKKKKKEVHRLDSPKKTLRDLHNTIDILLHAHDALNATSINRHLHCTHVIDEYDIAPATHHA